MKKKKPSFILHIHYLALSVKTEIVEIKDFVNVLKPAIAIRFLDFPTIIIDGKVRTKKLIFKCNFKDFKRNFAINARLATQKQIFLINFFARTRLWLFPAFRRRFST